MIDRTELTNTFNQLRQQQAQINGRDLTQFDELVGNKILTMALRAWETSSGFQNVQLDVRPQCPGLMEAASIATGGGKSQSSFAFIAAAVKLDPEFSAAYIVPTVKMGIEAQEGIEALLGEGSTTLWSSFHKHKGRDLARVERKLGFIPQRVVDKKELPDSRIVILTHKFLQSEIASDSDQGVRMYKGRLRDVVFIDEHPDLVRVVSTTPSAVQQFHDDLSRWEVQQDWLPILSDVAGRMAKTMQAADKGFIVPQLVSQEEAGVFSEATTQFLAELIADEMSSFKKQSEASRYSELILFLRAASQSSCFYSKMDKTFTAYQLDFEPQPGFMLLDATADINGLLELHPEIGIVRDVPQVNYENLKVRCAKLPKGFKSIREITKDHEKGEKYGRWIRRTVLANTKPGDDVLVVTHKDVLGLHFVKPADDVENPDDWEGRKVNTLNWGAGVGQNSWKNKTHVFLFNEFYPPRHKTISETHGWSLKPVSDEVLQDANSKKIGTDRYRPQGIYLNPFVGHLLRWSKQLAMRGNARNIDAQGNCQPMTLVVTTPLPDLLEHFERLYPGAPLPRAAEKPNGVEDIVAEVSGRDGLIDLLIDAPRSILGADEVQRRTGIQQSKLSREMSAESVQAVAQAYGWSLRSAKEIGWLGRMKYLVHDRSLVSDIRVAA
ncbi:MAG: hypothetical protein ABW078_00035 [Sedimenticola sp.]